MKADENENVINVERRFEVNAETLFKAWTDAEQLKQWWRPMGDSLLDVKNELKEGGMVAYYVGDSGLEITGTYSEVVPNEKLSYSWIWNMSDEGSESGYTLHITFSPDGEGSMLHVLQEGFSGPESLKIHEDGWEKGLDDLSSFLSSGGQNPEESSAESAPADEAQPVNDNLKNAEKMSDRSGGYNEAPEQVKVGGG